MGGAGIVTGRGCWALLDGLADPAPGVTDQYMSPYLF